MENAYIDDAYLHILSAYTAVAMDTTCYDAVLLSF